MNPYESPEEPIEAKVIDDSPGVSALERAWRAFIVILVIVFLYAAISTLPLVFAD